MGSSDTPVYGKIVALVEPTELEAHLDSHVSTTSATVMFSFANSPLGPEAVTENKPAEDIGASTA